MIHPILPDENSECIYDGCQGQLAYYKENAMGLDLYYCKTCFRVAKFDGRKLHKSTAEAYPDRDKTQ